MSDIVDLQKEALAFRDARDWAQFHNAKDLAAGLSIEASELLECFLWKDAKSADPAKIREEIADVQVYALLLAHEAKVDLPSAIREKLAKNALKYPVEKAKGRAEKYDQL
jgi:NTP pyrophosphatase (non-canonical NTP hydrolase)